VPTSRTIMSTSSGKSTAKRARKARTHDALRRLLLSFPGVEESVAWGTPAFHVRRKFLGRFHEDGESFVLGVDLEEREILLEAAPEAFHITEHYRNYPYVLVNVARIDREALRELVEKAWRRRAPKRMAAAFDRER
jgi:hypothetical protein